MTGGPVGLHTPLGRQSRPKRAVRRGSPGRLLLDWSPLLLESIPTNGVTLGGIHGMVASASPVLPRRDRGRAGSPG